MTKNLSWIFPNELKKVGKFGFKEVLYLGLIGVLSIIAADIIQDRLLKIIGVIILSIVFVVNSKMILKRIEELEKNVKEKS